MTFNYIFQQDGAPAHRARDTVHITADRLYTSVALAA